MKKRLISLGLLVVMALTLCVAPACRAKDNIIDDGKTINVKIYSAGYGTEYIYALAEQFEKTYADEGYKVNVLAPVADLNGSKVTQEIYASKQTADIYFTSGLTAERAVARDYGKTAADMTELVYNAKPIKFDGTEEELTVKEKLAAVEGYDWKTDYTYDLDGNGTEEYYSLPYVVGYTALAVNERVLTKTFGLDLPRTSNELIKCFESIMKQAVEENSATRPVTYSASGNGYPNNALWTWFAQYIGHDAFEQYWSMENPDGTPMDCINGTDCSDSDCHGHAYEVFDTEALQTALEPFYAMYDYNIAALNTGTQNFTAAQGQLLSGKAVFMSNGDWMFNEEKVRYDKELKDITFIKVPIISALGTKVFGSGTKYNFDDDKCDQILSTICKYADQNLAVEEVLTKVNTDLNVNLDKDDVQLICERRGYVSDASGAPAIISEKSNNKEIAALFLRMCASTDGGRLFALNSNTGSPYCMDAHYESEYAWHQSVKNIATNRYTLSFNKEVRGYRADMGVVTFMPNSGDVVSNAVITERVTVYDDATGERKTGADGSYDKFKTAAAKRALAEYEFAYKSITEETWKIPEKK